MTPEDHHGFSVVDLGSDEQVGAALKSLLEDDYKIQVDAVMNNGNLRAIVTPGIPGSPEMRTE
jgi:hypothetical protein